jgi:DNA-binding CsgD family transcriptional regulator
MSKSKYKEDIVELREKGFSYDRIKWALGCSKGTISYHCNKEGVEDIGLNDELSDRQIECIKETYPNHTKRETAEICDVSESSVQRYGDSKAKTLTEEEKREKQRARKEMLRQKQKSKAYDYLGGECDKCGYDQCSDALDFHHVHGSDKDLLLSSAFGRYPWEVIKEELDKCELLCANCHREAHS